MRGAGCSGCLTAKRRGRAPKGGTSHGLLGASRSLQGFQGFRCALMILVQQSQIYRCYIFENDWYIFWICFFDYLTDDKLISFNMHEFQCIEIARYFRGVVSLQFTVCFEEWVSRMGVMNDYGGTGAGGSGANQAEPHWGGKNMSMWKLGFLKGLKILLTDVDNLVAVTDHVYWYIRPLAFSSLCPR